MEDSHNYNDKISQLDAYIDNLQDEIKTLVELSNSKEKDNIFLSQENLNLQHEILRITTQMKLLEKKSDAKELESTESKLLQLKVNKLEKEKNNIISEFEMERKLFDSVLEKNMVINEEDITVLKHTVKKCRVKIGNLKDLLQDQRVKNTELQEQNLTLEKQIAKLEEKIRILEIKGDSVRVDRTECGILELKLQKLEQENKKILQLFEAEERFFAKELDTVKLDISEKESKSLLPGNGGNKKVTLKDAIIRVKEINTAKEQEIVYLSKENTTLNQKINSLQRNVRLLEEKMEAMQLDKNESKLLTLKVRVLEEENKKLINEFEMERKMFNSLLENHRIVQDREELIERLDKKLNKMHREITGVRDNLSHKEKENVVLMEKKLGLEKAVLKLEEKIRIFEEKDVFINIDKTESSLLELKLQKLEEEKKRLSDIFEMERLSYNKVYAQQAKSEQKIKHLIEENIKLKQMCQK